MTMSPFEGPRPGPGKQDFRAGAPTPGDPRPTKSTPAVPLQPASTSPELGAADQASAARLPLSPTSPTPPDARFGFRLPSATADVTGPRASATGPTDEPGATDANATPTEPVEQPHADAIDRGASDTPATPIVRRTVAATSGSDEERATERVTPKITLDRGGVAYGREGEIHVEPAVEPGIENSAYAESGTWVAGRKRGKDDTFESPVLNASSEGCRIVAIVNPRTGTAGVVHVGVEEMGTQVGEELVQEMIDAFPSLSGKAARAIVAGDVEASLLGPAAGEWNERLAANLRARGIPVTIVDEGEGKDVSIDTEKSAIKIVDINGDQIYPPEDPATPRRGTAEAR